MKRILIPLFLYIGVLSGCAFLQGQKADIGACWSDAECRTSAIERSKDYGKRAEDVASISGVPWAGKAAKNAVGYGSLILLLSAGGAALLGKKKVQNA